MRALDRVRNAFAWIAGYIATQRRLAQFTCGDCDRAARCGLPPGAKCEHRAARIAEDEWRDRRRARTLQPW